MTKKLLNLRAAREKERIRRMENKLRGWTYRTIKGWSYRAIGRRCILCLELNSAHLS